MAAFDFNVLERFKEADGSVTALLHCRPGSDHPDYCVAYGFDEEKGEWAHGTYTTDLAYACDLADPRVIEAATVRWSWSDLAYSHPGYSIMDAPYEDHVQLVDALEKACYSEAIEALKLWRGMAIAQGNERLAGIPAARAIVDAHVQGLKSTVEAREGRASLEAESARSGIEGILDAAEAQAKAENEQRGSGVDRTISREGGR